VFKGKAQIESAEISGVFEGDLVTTEKLIIHSTGRVYGNIRYGQIEIARGGIIAGQIDVLSGGSTDQGAHMPMAEDGSPADILSDSQEHHN
jgi:cytoskeletal protein CcmA (bactofilin family)